MQSAACYKCDGNGLMAGCRDDTMQISYSHHWLPVCVCLCSCMCGCRYGDIGQACARLARAFRMRVVALRRRTALTEEEQAAGCVVRHRRRQLKAQSPVCLNSRFADILFNCLFTIHHAAGNAVSRAMQKAQTASGKGW